MDLSRISYGSPVGLRTAVGLECWPMYLKWASDGFPMSLPWVSHGIPRGTAMGLCMSNKVGSFLVYSARPRVSHAEGVPCGLSIPIGLPWNFQGDTVLAYGSFMGLPPYCHGFKLFSSGSQVRLPWVCSADSWNSHRVFHRFAGLP